MRRVEADGDWSLLCPAECPGLADCWGEQFDELYQSYEKRGKVTPPPPLKHASHRFTPAPSLITSVLPGPVDHQSPGAVVRHLGRPDGDRHAVHAV